MFVLFDKLVQKAFWKEPYPVVINLENLRVTYKTLPYIWTLPYVWTLGTHYPAVHI